MNSAARLIMLAAAFALTGAACTVSTDAASPSATTEPSEIAPIFAVETMDGSFSLSDHLANDGRPVFLNLWASWCFPCREEMPAIDRSSLQHPDIAFIGVSVQDSREDAIAFAEEIGVRYTLGFDDDDSVDGAYRPLGLPASYIISSEGIILERIFGKITEDDLAEKFEKHFG
ncbi:MAG TPA: TlpA disulfide reductase family protein [Acidimicrobiia bacterium]|nr:TlpA disulfide reductase family protein [Acidimicrobiia bacterium]